MPYLVIAQSGLYLSKTKFKGLKRHALRFETYEAAQAGVERAAKWTIPAIVATWRIELETDAN